MVDVKGNIEAVDLSAEVEKQTNIASCVIIAIDFVGEPATW